MGAQSRVAAQPLLDEIERRWGLAQVMREACLEVADDDAKDGMSAEYHRLHRSLSRGLMRGWLNTFWVDEFCVHKLGIHPRDIYGPDWYDDAQPGIAYVHDTDAAMAA